MPNANKKIDLLELVQTAIKRDEELREKYQIGDKFRFVRDQLHTLLDQLQKHAQLLEPEKKKQAAGLAEDEVLVYVYLYNAQGLVMQTWHKMLTPKLFYEYSVNRPIYADKKSIESLVRSKANRIQHAFLTVAVKQKDISPMEGKDSLGNSTIKVREGGLPFNRLISLSHNDNEYILDEDGDLIKKPLPED